MNLKAGGLECCYIFLLHSEVWLFYGFGAAEAQYKAGDHLEKQGSKMENDCTATESLSLTGGRNRALTLKNSGEKGLHAIAASTYLQYL